MEQQQYRAAYITAYYMKINTIDQCLWHRSNNQAVKHPSALIEEQ